MPGHTLTQGEGVLQTVRRGLPALRQLALERGVVNVVQDQRGEVLLQPCKAGAGLQRIEALRAATRSDIEASGQHLLAGVLTGADRGWERNGEGDERHQYPARHVWAGRSSTHGIVILLGIGSLSFDDI